MTDMRGLAEFFTEHYAAPNPAHCKCGWKASIEGRFLDGYVPVLDQYAAHMSGELVTFLGEHSLGTLNAGEPTPATGWALPVFTTEHAVALAASDPDIPTYQRPAGTLPLGSESWADRHGDVWTVGTDGLMHTPETAPFPRDYVERKWGPLRQVGEERLVHNHPPYEPVCNEALIDGVLLGACMRGNAS
jgi:hypothetical protein